MVKGPPRDYSSRQHSSSLWSRFVRTLTRTTHKSARFKKSAAKKEEEFDPRLQFFKDGDELEEYCKSLHY